jgi:hypothetical protein
MADDAALAPPENALLAYPEPAPVAPAAEAALVARGPGTVLARSRYEAPTLQAVLPRPDTQPQLMLPMLPAPPGAAAGAAPGSPDGGRAPPPRGACRALCALRLARGALATAAARGQPRLPARARAEAARFR